MRNAHISDELTDEPVEFRRNAYYVTNTEVA